MSLTRKQRYRLLHYRLTALPHLQDGVVISKKAYFLLLLLGFTSADIIFSQIFRNSFQIVHKKDFRHKFSFLTDSLQTPTPLMVKIC